MDPMDLESILANIDDREIDLALDLIADLADYMTEADVTTIMDLARSIDPTFSGDGALVRDALRDNTDYTIL